MTIKRVTFLTFFQKLPILDLSFIKSTPPVAGDVFQRRKRSRTMGILSWIVFGLIAGVIAKFIMPGRDGGGFILTCVLGIVGAVVGGWLATFFGIGGDVTGFNLQSFLVAVVGAIVVLLIYRMLRRD